MPYMASGGVTSHAGGLKPLYGACGVKLGHSDKAAVLGFELYWGLRRVQSGGSFLACGLFLDLGICSTFFYTVCGSNPSLCIARRSALPAGLSPLAYGPERIWPQKAPMPACVSAHTCPSATAVPRHEYNVLQALLSKPKSVLPNVLPNSWATV